MPIPRPKILTRFTLASSLDLKIYYSSAAEFDVSATATIPAGSYYMAWDCENNDFLWKLCNVVNVALDTAATAGAWVGWTGRANGMSAMIEEDGKIRLGFLGGWFGNLTHQKVKIAWTEADGTTVGELLGFDTSADLSLTTNARPTTLANWQHPYGWYADADGMLEFLGSEDYSGPEIGQSIAPSNGQGRTQYLGSQFTNDMILSFIPRTKAWSKNISYQSSSVYPYEKNEPLQCWWKEAIQGTEFRVYRDGAYLRNRLSVNTYRFDRYTEEAKAVAVTTTTLQDTGKAWTTEPQQFAGRLILCAFQFAEYVFGSSTVFFLMRWKVASHDTDTITVTNTAEPQNNMTFANYTSAIYDQPYSTYVLDVNKMKRFEPEEIDNIDKFRIKIPLRRYVP